LILDFCESLADGVFVLQIQAHATHIGFMDDLARGKFDGDRKSHLGCQERGFIGRAAKPATGQRQGQCGKNLADVYRR
jgi:hypothetical protein